MAQVTRLGLYGGPRAPYNFIGDGTAVITGTSFTEAQIVSGGQTIVITLTGDTWLAAGTGPIGSTANTQALIDGMTSAQVEATGWNAEVRDKEVTTAVVRTSDSVCTITLTAAGAYDVTSNETITITSPAEVLTEATVVVASPSILVTAAASGDDRRDFTRDIVNDTIPSNIPWVIAA